MIMLGSSVMVLSALTVTGLYVFMYPVIVFSTPCLSRVIETELLLLIKVLIPNAFSKW